MTFNHHILLWTGERKKRIEYASSEGNICREEREERGKSQGNGERVVKGLEVRWNYRRDDTPESLTVTRPLSLYTRV